MELTFGGRCRKHPLEILPCKQCAAEHISTSAVLDIDGLRDLLREMSRPTTQAGLSKALDVSPQYLSDVMLGRRAPGPKLLKALGLREQIRYVKDQP